jgi:hypothetical protein
MFTLLGGIKLWGLKQGIVGGAGKPFGHVDVTGRWG